MPAYKKERFGVFVMDAVATFSARKQGRFVLNMPGPLADRLDRQADRLNLSRADIIRVAVNEYLETLESIPDNEDVYLTKPVGTIVRVPKD